MCTADLKLSAERTNHARGEHGEPGGSLSISSPSIGEPLFAASPGVEVKQNLSDGSAKTIFDGAGMPAPSDAADTIGMDRSTRIASLPEGVTTGERGTCATHPRDDRSPGLPFDLSASSTASTSTGFETAAGHELAIRGRPRDPDHLLRDLCEAPTGTPSASPSRPRPLSLPNPRDIPVGTSTHNHASKLGGAFELDAPSPNYRDAVTTQRGP